MTRSASCRLVLIAGSVFLGVLASTAWADKVLYKDGRAPVEGSVVEQNADQVVIQTKFGQVTIPMKDVLRIETGKTAAETFKEKWAAVDQNNVEALLALATWCDDNGLSRETKKIYRRVIEVDPNHETAHRALGDVLVDGKWVSKKDLDAQEKARKDLEKKEKAEADKAKKAAGTAKKGGKAAAGGTQSEASAEVAPFLTVIAENKEEDEKLRQSLEDFFGQKFTVQTCERFSLRGQLPMDENGRLLAFGEKMLVTVNKLFGKEPGFQPWPGQYLWFHVKQKGTYQDLIDWIDKNVDKFDADSKKFFKDGGGLMSTQPKPLSAKLEGGLPLDHEMANEVGNMWVSWYAGNPRSWLREGFGAYTCVLEFGVNELWHSTNTKYAGKTDLAEKNKDAHMRLVCHDIIAGASEKPHPFIEIFQKKLNDLDYADLAKSWSLVDFLMTEHREQFDEYLRKLRGYPDDETAFREIFGWSSEDLEGKWKDYVLKNYPNK